MSSDASGSRSPYQQRNAPSRRRSLLVVGALSIGTLALVGPSIAGAMGFQIDRPASSQPGGFVMAERLDPPPPRPTAPPPPAPTPGVSAEVRAVLDLTNAERAQRGVAPLQLHPQLMEAADAHFRDQFRQGCSNLSHTGTDDSSPFDRIKRTGLRYRAAGENIACGYGTPSAVMNGWMNSSGHRQNILNGGFTHIGIVAAPDAFGRMYWVQVFATPR